MSLSVCPRTNKDLKDVHYFRTMTLTITFYIRHGLRHKHCTLNLHAYLPTVSAIARTKYRNQFGLKRSIIVQIPIIITYYVAQNNVVVFRCIQCYISSRSCSKFAYGPNCRGKNSLINSLLIKINFQYSKMIYFLD